MNATKKDKETYLSACYKVIHIIASIAVLSPL